MDRDAIDGAIASPSMGAGFGTARTAPLRYDDAAGVAGWLAKNAELGLASGAVLAVPNPAPMDNDAIDGAIAAALEAAAARGVSGKDATPFLLAKLEEVTGGASLEANVALVLNNARV